MARQRALAATVFVVVLVAGCGGTSPRPPAGADRAPLFISPSGDDGGPCSRHAPCRSLAGAYRLAHGRQAIELLGGHYPAQQLGPAPAPRGGPVVVRPARGARVRFAGRLTVSGVQRLRFEDLDLARPGADDRSLYVGPCVSDVTFARVSGETFFLMEGTERIAFRGGSWGGYSAPGQEDSAIGTSGPTGPEDSCHGRPAGPAHAVTFDGVTFHDVFWGVPAAGWGGSHPDCFEVNGYVSGLVITHSRFVRCASTFMQINGDQGDLRGVRIEDNLFGDLGNDSWYGIQITSEGKPGRCAGLVFSHNTYLPANPRATTWADGPIRTDCEPPAGSAPVRVFANLFARGPQPNECARYAAAPYGARWSDNLFAHGTCGVAASGVPYGYTLSALGLRPSPFEAGRVREVFAAAALGTTADRVARSLGWTTSTVKAIVADRAYAGGAYGADGANPPLVTAAAWQAAQALAGS